MSQQLLPCVALAQQSVFSSATFAEYVGCHSATRRFRARSPPQHFPSREIIDVSPVWAAAMRGEPKARWKDSILSHEPILLYVILSFP
jgi:hypothetical protein